VFKGVENVPTHVAIIPDGNRRYAEKRGITILEAYEIGALRAREAARHLFRRGVKVVTFYALSTENLARRSREEVAIVEEVLVKSVLDAASEAVENGVRILAIGDFTKLPKLGEVVKSVAKATAGGDKTLVLAINYGSWQEVARAARGIAEAVAKGVLSPSDVNEAILRRHLYTSDIPDPDLVIRSGGERRLSNFLLLQAAYAELYFIDKLWPEVSEEDLDQALAWFSTRNRRFGR